MRNYEYFILVLLGLICSACLYLAFSANAAEISRAPANLPPQYAMELIELPSDVSGGQPIKVAVIDTGLERKHPQFNKMQVLGGTDLTLEGDATRDSNGHGTHVSGIISQIAPLSIFYPIKYYNERAKPSVNLINMIKALYIAVEAGAKVINISAGGPEFNTYEFAAMRNAELSGALIVVAAGNDGGNLDIEETKYYPAAYNISTKIAVASVDKNFSLVKTSNYGKKHIDLAAPGHEVVSSVPYKSNYHKNAFFQAVAPQPEGYSMMSGTSQATAFVTGAAALVWGQCPEQTAGGIKKILLESSTFKPNLEGKVATSGVLNVRQAMEYCKKTKVRG